MKENLNSAGSMFPYFQENTLYPLKKKNCPESNLALLESKACSISLETSKNNAIFYQIHFNAEVIIGDLYSYKKRSLS